MANTLQDYERDYWAPDREAILKNLRGANGADELNKVNNTPEQQAAQGGGGLPPSPAPSGGDRSGALPASPSSAPTMGIPGGPETRGPGTFTPPIQVAGTVNGSVPGGVGNNTGNYRQTEDSWINFLKGGGGGASAGSRDGFFNTNTSVPDLVNQFNQKTGQHATYVGGPSGDLVDFGDGRGPVDVHNAAGQIWYDEGNRPGGLNMGGGAGAGSGGSGASGPGGSGGQVDEAFRAQLLNLMQGGARNPNIDAVNNAYKRERLQGADRERGAQAERMAFEGLNAGGQGSGAFDTTLGGINEQASQDIAGHAGQMELQDYQARRQDLMHALEIANAVGARTEANALQMQLAQMDQQYRYTSLNQNQSQWNDRYGLDRADLEQRANRQSYLDLMNG